MIDFWESGTSGGGAPEPTCVPSYAAPFAAFSVLVLPIILPSSPLGRCLHGSSCCAGDGGEVGEVADVDFHHEVHHCGWPIAPSEGGCCPKQPERQLCCGRPPRSGSERAPRGPCCPPGCSGRGWRPRSRSTRDGDLDALRLCRLLRQLDGVAAG